MPEPNSIVPTTRAQLARLASTAVERAEALGVRTAGTRFKKYEEFLQDAAARQYPRRIDWVADRAKLLWELEAIGQCMQLGCSVLLRDIVEKSLLADRIKVAMTGQDLPTIDDKARNTLLELTTAYMLSKFGIRAELTTASEDLVLHVPGRPPLPAECKRPSAPRTVKPNVKDARQQLARLRDRYPQGGVVVVGLDRVAGVSGELGSVATPDELPAAVEQVLHQGALNVAVLGGPKLAANAIAVITLLAGAVFTVEPARPIAVLRMAILALPGAGERQATVDAMLKGERASAGPPLSELFK